MTKHTHEQHRRSLGSLPAKRRPLETCATGVLDDTGGTTEFTSDPLELTGRLRS